MTVSKRLLPVMLILCGANALGQQPKREPHIGYVYPGGGQQGAVCEITVGGQLLRGAKKVHVTGEGVHAEVIEHYRAVRNIQKEQREELQDRLRTLREKLGESPEKQRGRRLRRNRPAARNADKAKAKANADKRKAPPTAPDKKSPAEKKTATKKPPFRPVRHPLLYNLEEKSLRELRHVAHQVFFPRQKKQINTQIAEMVLIRVTVDPDAPPGDRELRVVTPLGLTNPMVFQVGEFAEVRDLEPNDPKAYVNPKEPKAPAVDLPVLLNGQIMPGDVDRFRIRARKGQKLVMQVSARRLVPFLADAVPGWFQATLALFDEKGSEVAFADDFRFDPDPVLFCRIPKDGVYELEIHDSIYRGREDFVYRIAVGLGPFVTQLFPLGGRAGVKTFASIDGWNLTNKRMPLDTEADGGSVRQTALRQRKRLSNSVTYAVDTLPECADTEPNDTAEEAQPIDLPQIINGRIGKPGDVDVFRIEGRAGDEVVAEVLARGVRSPLDSVLRFTDASGHVLQWNDDSMDRAGVLHRDMGVLTHHADSYLRAQLSKDGVYYVHLADSQQHGGGAYGYRLRVGPLRPDFALRVTPSSINIRAGFAAPVRVHVMRKDGFSGDVELVLEDAPPGFRLHGARIPAGCDRVNMTVSGPRMPPREPVVLHLEGRARIGGKTVSRPAVPAEDVMQAFLYRHLAPSQELVAAVLGKGRGPHIELAADGPVRIPAGGTARVQVKTPKRPALRDIKLELRDPPEGVTLHDVSVVQDGLAFVLKADEQAMPVGFADNLIVEASAKGGGRQRGGNAKRRQGRVSLGVLPAISFEIVQR